MHLRENHLRHILRQSLRDLRRLGGKTLHQKLDGNLCRFLHPPLALALVQLKRTCAALAPTLRTPCAKNPFPSTELQTQYRDLCIFTCAISCARACATCADERSNTLPTQG
jgi:hypothetical protein